MSGLWLAISACGWPFQQGEFGAARSQEAQDLEELLKAAGEAARGQGHLSSFQAYRHRLSLRWRVIRFYQRTTGDTGKTIVNDN